MKARKFPSCPLPRNVTLSQRLQREVGNGVFLVTTDVSTNHSNGILKKVGKGSITVDIERGGRTGFTIIPFSELIQLTGEGLNNVPRNVTLIESLQGPDFPFGFVLGETFELFLVQIGQDFVEIIDNDTTASLINRVYLNRRFIKSLVCEEHEE